MCTKCVNAYYSINSKQAKSTKEIIQQDHVINYSLNFCINLLLVLRKKNNNYYWNKLYFNVLFKKNTP